MSVKDSFYKVPKVVFLVIAKALKTEVLVIESQGERIISGVLRATGQLCYFCPPWELHYRQSTQAGTERKQQTGKAPHQAQVS